MGAEYLGGGGHIWTPSGQEWSQPLPVCGGTQENDFGAKTGEKKKKRPASTPHHTTPYLSSPVYWKVGTAWAEPGSE